VGLRMCFDLHDKVSAISISNSNTLVCHTQAVAEIIADTQRVDAITH